MAKTVSKSQISIKQAQEREQRIFKRILKAAQFFIYSLNLPAGVSEQMGDYYYYFSH